MAGRPVVIRVTHEFMDDPATIDRAYNAWASYLAEGLSFADDGEDTVKIAVKVNRRRLRGSA